ncbi:FAD-dependent oxidoreductase, partial [Klebsiella pneumoniae]
MGRFKRTGCNLITDRRIEAIERTGATWRLAAGDWSVSADIVVNAAGAWADQVAAMVGARSVGIVPKRR